MKKTVKLYQDKYLNELKGLVLKVIGREKVKIILFGSRARSDYHRTSDIDVGLIPYAGFDKKKITLLKAKVEELNIPYKVEIVNFQDTAESFKKEALKEAIVWKG